MGQSQLKSCLSEVNHPLLFRLPLQWLLLLWWLLLPLLPRQRLWLLLLPLPSLFCWLLPLTLRLLLLLQLLPLARLLLLTLPLWWLLSGQQLVREQLLQQGSSRRLWNQLAAPHQTEQPSELHRYHGAARLPHGLQQGGWGWVPCCNGLGGTLRHPWRGHQHELPGSAARQCPLLFLLHTLRQLSKRHRAAVLACPWEGCLLGFPAVSVCNAAREVAEPVQGVGPLAGVTKVCTASQRKGMACTDSGKQGVGLGMRGHTRMPLLATSIDMLHGDDSWHGMPCVLCQPGMLCALSAHPCCAAA